MKRCFFFGAGAEVSYGLCDGKDFAKIVLGTKISDGKTKNNNKNEKINDNLYNLSCAIDEYYTAITLSNNKEKNEWYTTFRKNNNYLITKESIYKASLKQKHLDSSKEFDTKKEYDKAVNDEYQILSDQDKEDLIENHISYLDILDKYFHTLISPKCFGPDNFWKVVCCYTRAYLYLVGEILYNKNNITKEEYRNILDNPKETINKLNQKCDKLGKEKNGYYNVINDYNSSKHKKDEINVITTNYTPLCNCIAFNNQYDDKIAYLNGKFGLFESARDLMVYDIVNDKKELIEHNRNASESNTNNIESKLNDVLFPYIFIQSGVKPIIDEHQLKEYTKAMKFLEDAEELIVVGYKFNYDDNHINSIIKSYFLRKGLKIVYFNYVGNSSNIKDNNLSKEESDYKIKKRILNKLHIFNNDKDSKFVSQIKVITIDSKNCFEKFNSYVFND